MELVNDNTQHPKIYTLQREKIFSYEINYPIMQSMDYSLKETLKRLTPKLIEFSLPVRDLQTRGEWCLSSPNCSIVKINNYKIRHKSERNEIFW